MKPDKQILLCVSVLVLMAGFFITDCTNGTNSYKRAFMVGKTHTPESTVLIWDGEEFDTVDVPESFSLQLKDKEGTTWNVAVDSRCYQIATNGMSAVVLITKGKWTGWHYRKTLKPSQIPDDELSIERKTGTSQ